MRANTRPRATECTRYTTCCTALTAVCGCISQAARGARWTSVATDFRPFVGVGSSVKFAGTAHNVVSRGGGGPLHVDTRDGATGRVWRRAARGTASAPGSPCAPIARVHCASSAMDVDISSLPALDKDDLLIRFLAESSGLPEWDDAMMDGEFQTRSLMITANPSIDPREPQKKGKHKKKAKKSHLALPAPTGLPTNGSPMEEDAPTDNVNSQDKCPGFQFTDRTNNGKVPAHGSPPKPAKKPPTSSSSTAESSSPVTKKKKWRVGGTTKVTEFDPSDINKRVFGLEQDVHVIRHDIGQINDAKDNTQLLLHMVLKGQGWTDEQILKTVPAPKEKPELPPSLNMTPKPHSDEPLRTPTVGPTITPDSRSHSAKVSSRKRCGLVEMIPSTTSFPHWAIAARKSSCLSPTSYANKGLSQTTCNVLPLSRLFRMLKAMSMDAILWSERPISLRIRLNFQRSWHASAAFLLPVRPDQAES